MTFGISRFSCFSSSKTHEVDNAQHAPARPTTHISTQQTFPTASVPALTKNMGRAKFESNLRRASESGANSSSMPNAHPEFKPSESKPPLPSADVDNPKNIDRLSKNIYRNGRLYQGTNEELAAESRQNGQDPAKKVTPSMDKATEEGFFEGYNPEDIEAFKAESSTRFYHTELLEGDDHNLGATDYANKSSNEGNPQKVLRSFGLKQAGLLESDPDTARDNLAKTNPAHRTADSTPTPAGYFLESKNSPPVINEASEAFKHEFNNSNGRRPLKINTVISSQQAAEMLREQQTPSATDFKETPPWKK